MFNYINATYPPYGAGRFPFLSSTQLYPVVCMCVCACVRVCVCACMRAPVCVWVCMRVRARARACVRACVRVFGSGRLPFLPFQPRLPSATPAPSSPLSARTHTHTQEWNLAAMPSVDWQLRQVCTTESGGVGG